MYQPGWCVSNFNLLDTAEQGPPRLSLPPPQRPTEPEEGMCLLSYHVAPAEVIPVVAEEIQASPDTENPEAATEPPAASAPESMCSLSYHVAPDEVIQIVFEEPSAAPEAQEPEFVDEELPAAIVAECKCSLS
jgi:hypothetical protein